MSQYLQEAFTKLTLLEEEDFNLSDTSEIDDMKSFMDDNEEIMDFEDVIDPEAETEDDLEDSYIGKVILDCTVCHSKIYKNAEDVHYDEETDLANVEEECPFCYSSDGFEIVGQVAPYEETEINVDVEPKDENEDDIEIEDEEEVEDKEIKESFKSRKNKRLNESKRKSLKESLTDFDLPLGDIVNNSLFRSRPIVVYDAHNEELYNGYSNLLPDELCDSTLAYLDGYPIEFYISETAEDLGYEPEEEEVDEEPMDESLKEALENVDIETEHDRIHVSSEEKDDFDSEEVIAPIEPAQEADILADEEEPETGDEEEVDFSAEEEPEMGGDEEEEVDYDVEDFDEEPFNTMGESYLKKVYDNVNSFKTSNVRVKGNNLFVEGVINFKSGKNKATTFKFEAKDCTKGNKVRFIGENLQISRGKKSFTLRGTMNRNRFIPESLNYNYRVNGTRVYGTEKSPRKK